MKTLSKVFAFSLVVCMGTISSLVFAQPALVEKFKQQEQIDTTKSFEEKVELGEVPVDEVRTLADSINGTLQTNRRIKILQENRDTALENITAAKAGYGPRVDVRANMTGSTESSPSSRMSDDDGPLYSSGAANVVLTQPVWDGFATKSRVLIAEATKDSIVNRLYDNATTLALDAIIAHIDLIRLRQVLALSQRNVDRHQELLISARAREEVGADTMADVSKAEGRLSRALSSLADSKASLFIGEAAYLRITGLSLPTILEEVALPQDMFPDIKLVLSSAEVNNPKIKAFKDDIRIAEGRKELTKSAFQPVFNIEAGPTYSDTSQAKQTDQYEMSFDVRGVVSWNLYNSGADMASTRASAAQVREFRQVMYNFMDDLVLEIRSTWTGYENAKELLIHYSNALKFNKITIEAYTEQFYAGQRSLLDVLDAESELYSSATQTATAAGNILVNGYKLYGLAANLLAILHINTSSLSGSPLVDDSGPVMSF